MSFLSCASASLSAFEEIMKHKVVKLRPDGKDRILETLENNIDSVNQLYVAWVDKEGCLNFAYSSIWDTLAAVGSLEYLKQKLLDGLYADDE